MKRRFHWRPKERDEEDVPGNSENYRDKVITRKTRLRVGETEVIRMAMGTAKLEKAITVVRDKVVAEESTEVIAIPLNPARRRQVVLKVNIHARWQWVTNPITMKSTMQRAESSPTTLSVRAVVLATPMPAMATMRYRATPLTAAGNRMKSRIQMAEEGYEKQIRSKSATLSNHGQDEYSRSANIRHYRNGEAKDP